MRPIRVIGAGVSGLTSAVVLLEAGYDVEIWAREFSPDITSAVAAAIWYPLRGEREDRYDRWLPYSFGRFTQLAADPTSGVALRGGIELFREPRDDTWWRDLLPGFRHARPDELPPGYADGFVADGIPGIEMPVYLDWLTRRVEALRGRIGARAILSLDEALEGADVAVNCSGLGAREIAGDPAVHAVRGQVVRVEQFGLDRYVLDEAHPHGVLYVYPRSRDVVCGGTREPGDESLEPKPETARAILERCAALEPRVLQAKVVSHAVGLRPARARIRVEAEERDDGLVVHDYGHGGNGVTLSWGCAADVLGLVSARVPPPARQ